MSVNSKEILESFDLLPEIEKRKVASEILRRAYITELDVELDETKLAALYAESSAEDRDLAEQGLEDYTSGLAKEDGE